MDVEPGASDDGSLVAILDRLVNDLYAGRPVEITKGEVRSALAGATIVELSQVGRRVWDEYSAIDVELVIAILRRWTLLDSDSEEARRTLGSYLLCHGPDWDDEAHDLLNS